MGEEEGCPDVEFEGVLIPECNVDVGVSETLYLCKEVKNLDCQQLLQQYENREISGEQLMKQVASATDNPNIRFNIDVIRKVVKEEPLDD